MFVQLTKSLSLSLPVSDSKTVALCLFLRQPVHPSHLTSLRFDSSCLGSARRLKSVADEAGSKFGRQTNRQAGRRAKSE